MPKNIVICCDGTNNQFAGEHTNVIRTYRVARRNAGQVTFYDPGVGTMPEPGREGSLAKRWSIIKGLAFGSGLFENIEDAYRFLMSVHEPGDAVFLFGFSRGAYTARALAGMLHSVGLLHPGTENLFRFALKYWRSDFGKDSPGGRLCLEFRTMLSRPCPVRFIGVWDTVSSVGYVDDLITGKYVRLPYTATNPGVETVRHAVAIDERRHFFRQNLMHQCPENISIKNVWFAGVHSDVGGGYPASEADLARLTFGWMMREAANSGLDIDQAVLRQEVDRMGRNPPPEYGLHESLQSGWKIAEWLPSRRYSAADGKFH
jgi:uncharacterized protein (DUF2235 family)